MKTNFLLILAMAVLGYITLSSRSGGAGSVANSEAAGTPGATTCMNCHMGGTFNPTTTIDIKNSSGLNNKMKLIVPILFIFIFILVGYFKSFYQKQMAKHNT